MTRRPAVIALALAGASVGWTPHRVSSFGGGSGSRQEVRPCPEDMILVDDGRARFCVDRHEFPNRPGERPWVGLSGVAEDLDVKAGRVLDAERLCASVGKRVCTAKEWTEACRGSNKLRYPWGNDLPRYTHDRSEGVCNYDRSYRAPDELKVALRDPAEMTRLDQSEPSGNRPGCVSGYGVYDMGGNAREWVKCPGVGKYGWCQSFAFWSSPGSCERFTTIHSPKWHLYESSTRCCTEAR